MDPFDYMLKRFGENLVGLVAVAFIVAALKIAGAL